MSEPLEQPAPSLDDAPTREEETPEPLNFALSIVTNTPTPVPLSFPHLPATTTIKQLKAKIRDALPSKPTDAEQRLIYRGHMLGREMDTMLDIFGQETLASPETQHIHLVLPPTASENSSLPPVIQVPIAEHLRHNTVPRNFPPRPQSTPLNAVHGLHAQQQLPGFQHVHQHQVLQNHDINGQAFRLQQMQREAQRLNQELIMLEQRARAMVPGATLPGPIGALPTMYQVPQRQAPMAPFPPGFPPFQNLVHQQQRERAAQGLHGAQDLTGNIHPSASAPGSGRASPVTHRPDHTTTYTREGIGPNGQRWQVTVNETTTTVSPDGTHHHHHHSHNPQTHLHNGLNQPLNPLTGVFANQQMNPQVNLQANPVLEIQNILRNADRLNAHNSMQRSASNPHPAPSQPMASGSQQPSAPRPTIARSLTNNNQPSASLPLGANVQGYTAPTAQTSRGSAAYILSSPSGPQALLISSAGNYWTPAPLPRPQAPVMPDVVPGQIPAPPAAAGLPEFRNRGHRVRRVRDRQENPAPVVNAVHQNPAGGAIGAQIGPMIWLIVRLAGFVWFFTSGGTSWLRFIIITGLAVVLFIANTGIFNGAAEQIWGPIRRHLEGLLPLAGPDAAMVPAANVAIVPQHAPVQAQPELPATENGGANPNIRRRQRAPEPDPAVAAARILAQQRQDQGWVLQQVRRAEHALLLFLASLIPGVGERHIAAREAEATAAEAERQRRIDEANAAEAALNEAAEQISQEGDSVAGARPSEGGENNGGAPEAPALIDV